jgi:hypothetical protein
MLALIRGDGTELGPRTLVHNPLQCKCLGGQ